MKFPRFFPVFLSVLLFAGLLGAPARAASELVSEMEVNCGSCLLEDVDTDTVLYGQNNDQKIYPASVTKVLTALVVLRHVEAGELSLGDTVTASDTFRTGLTADAASGGIESGEKLTVENLLYMLLLPSHCDAANVLAEAASGSLDAFAEEMNAVAAELGCTGSHFVNPSGLHDSDHYTTCNDLYLIGKAAYQYETFRTIISSAHYTVPATNTHEARALHNTNALICDDVYSTYLYENCVGGKTGSTYPAGYCLLSFAQQDGKTLCCVMMGCNWLINRDGSKDRLQFSESVRLYKWAFENFSTVPVVAKGAEEGSVAVEKGREKTVTAVAAEEVSLYLPSDVSAEDCVTSAALTESVEAPVEAGAKLGVLTVTLNGESVATVDLVAAAAVEEQPRILDRLFTVEHAPRPSVLLTAIPAVLGTALGLVLLFFLVQALRRRMNRRRRRRQRRGDQKGRHSR